jgi:hypothetical protein
MNNGMASGVRSGRSGRTDHVIKVVQMSLSAKCLMPLPLIGVFVVVCTQGSGVWKSVQKTVTL